MIFLFKNNPSQKIMNQFDIFNYIIFTEHTTNVFTASFQIGTHEMYI